VLYFSDKPDREWHGYARKYAEFRIQAAAQQRATVTNNDVIERAHRMIADEFNVMRNHLIHLLRAWELLEDLEASGERISSYDFGQAIGVIPFGAPWHIRYRDPVKRVLRALRATDRYENGERAKPMSFFHRVVNDRTGEAAPGAFRDCRIVVDPPVSDEIEDAA
jgi:hypothetical protein